VLDAAQATPLRVAQLPRSSSRNQRKLDKFQGITIRLPQLTTAADWEKRPVSRF
jgi:hypothetical protein